ncbi:TerD family protein (plasmid) [Pseudomonas silesiensis]|uniref:TerD family protein n=1 Tax=Pseudomonas silesiensis TaxID=1853130 RepID=UPI0030D3348B
MNNVVATSITLAKREKLSLKKARPSLTEVSVAITWHVSDKKGPSVDVDLSALMLDENNRILTEQDFIYYGQHASPEGSVLYLGDNQTGSKEGDEGVSEAIKVTLNNVPERVKRILFVVTIDEAVKRRQTFEKAKNAVAQLFDKSNDQEIARWPLKDDYKEDSAMLMCDLHRNGNGWDYEPIGQGYQGDLEGICKDHGLVFG